ncbi:hypothetical protein TWF970_009242 [Orbilia oligospora]|uniref:Uncharacterized protein n=1 Tax=Orbilia oligospora TaxID=2813651 RepID=A0A7C8R3D6_ORBOL|nr:hypothetical protein TWF970_009242 [Orbilia oligospora]
MTEKNCYSDAREVMFRRYDQIKFRVAEYRGKQGQDLSSIDYLLSSGAAGVASAALTNPLWVVKTRMLTSGYRGPGAYRGVAQGLLDLAKKEGIRGYFRGFLPSLFGVLQAAIQFMTYEKLKIWRRSSRLESSISDGDRQQLQSGSRQQGMYPAHPLSHSLPRLPLQWSAHARNLHNIHMLVGLAAIIL